MPKSTLEQDNIILKQCLLDMIVQNCTEREGESVRYHSGFISAHADAMRVLCAMGVLKEVGEGFGRSITVEISRGWEAFGAGPV